MISLQREHSLFLRMSWKPASLIAGGHKSWNKYCCKSIASQDGNREINPDNEESHSRCEGCATYLHHVRLFVSCATKNPVYVFMDSSEVNSTYIDCIDSHLSYPILINIKIDGLFGPPPSTGITKIIAEYNTR
jgi:hypothetical protein